MSRHKSNTLDLVFVQANYRLPPLDEAVSAMADTYRGRGVVVNNTVEMVGRAISMCINHHKQIGRLTFVGHGSSSTFRIGKDVITEDVLKPGYWQSDPNYFGKNLIRSALLSLRPYFAPGALVIIQACHCGQGQKLLRAVAPVVGVPVVGWSSDIYFREGGGAVTYEDGYMTVCISQMCTPPAAE
jgi:hypothetical protein